MPRGDNPNSKKNLKKGGSPKPFTSDNASEMQKKSTEAKRAAKSVKEAIWNITSPEEVAEAIVTGAIKHKNTKYMDMLLDVTGEKAAKKQEVEVTARQPFAGMSDDELKELISGD